MAKVKKVVVDTLQRHVSPDGVFRKPGTDNSRYVLELKGEEEPSKHVIVIEELDATAAPPKREKAAAPPAAGIVISDAEFKKLEEAKQLEAVKVCEDAEQLTGWGVDLNEGSAVYKAIMDRIQEIENGKNE